MTSSPRPLHAILLRRASDMASFRATIQSNSKALAAGGAFEPFGTLARVESDESRASIE
jgi:hypothetical protein